MSNANTPSSSPSEQQQLSPPSSSQDQPATTHGNSSEDDCTPCRIMGAGTFIGLGIYTATLRNDQFHGAPHPSLKNTWWTRFLNKNAGVMRGGLAATFVSLGMYRLFVGKFGDRLVAF